MRIAIGGFAHETNSFGNTYVTLEDAVRATTLAEQMDRTYPGRRSFHGGFYAAAKDRGVQIVATRDTYRLPSGPFTQEAFEFCRDRLVEALVEANRQEKLDGIALFMHGGGAAIGHPDLEGDVLRAIREKLGNDIPIALPMDLHANVSQEMADLADVITGNKHYPHIDNYEAAYDAFTYLVDMIETGHKTCRRLVRLPWHMVPAQGVTTSGPAADIRELSQKLEKDDPQLLNVTPFQGFPYADVARAGVTVVATALTQEAADRNALRLARYAWSRREDMKIPLYSAEEAVALAIKAPCKPALIHESADNPGGGAPGDGTHLLRAMLQANVPSAFGYISDPEVAELAAKAGVGARISCRLGGKRDSLHGAPVELTDALVTCVSDGKTIRKNPMGKGNQDNYGTTVCLEAGNVKIIVCCSRNQTYDDGPFELTGVDWQSLEFIALKSAQHFKGYFADLVQTIIPCESPGIQTANLALLPFKHANLTYYPLQNAQWNE